MLQERVQRIIKDVAKEKGLTEHLVEKAFKNQFQVVRDAIQNSHERDEYPIIYIRFFGKFVPSLKYIARRKRFIEFNERKKKIEGDN
jgi:nucleoid DNA-binding protein